MSLTTCIWCVDFFIQYSCCPQTPSAKWYKIIVSKSYSYVLTLMWSFYVCCKWRNAAACFNWLTVWLLQNFWCLLSQHNHFSAKVSMQSAGIIQWKKWTNDVTAGELSNWRKGWSERACPKGLDPLDLSVFAHVCFFQTETEGESSEKIPNRLTFEMSLAVTKWDKTLCKR